MDTKNKMRIVFNSNSSGLITIEEELENDDENKIIKDVNMTRGRSLFPTSEIEINLNANHPNLVSVKTDDYVEIYVTENNLLSNKIFYGILSSVTVNNQKNNFNFMINAVSPFFLLQKRKVSFHNFKNKKGLREVLNELVELCGINGKIEVEVDIKDQFFLTPFKSFQALSIINAICYDLDLVYDFNNGETMTISNRSKILNELHTSIPYVIDNDEIISLEFKQ